ncbi:2-amino-1-hydroxyethylphosphonate dioxygenase (glycine-forming) [Pseudocercospora fuligena]|uniref:2-amino-1-hydroxyethylphosphonate dioxygenase (Glycine-forming) n=1 Tax=Pseudocercospora fuligena TaxID=685502 RepID=A0A8H6RSP3_9PEZI|nr:2-amino-1-hydroxyethylphosphonate dioxygenase (glycine-forming) [Pseudocercospora fuligena]
MSTPRAKAEFLVKLLNTKGQGDYIGEPISQLEHSLQAAHLARVNGSDEETVIAALLHDIGQFLPSDQVKSIAHEVRNMTSEKDDSAGGVGRVGHERIGEQYLLKLGFPQKVASLVGSHVAAKRYLCAVEPGYHDTLSEASKKSLIFQGGPMDGEELKQWQASPWCEEMCRCVAPRMLNPELDADSQPRLRKWDDSAKVVGLQVQPADSYRAAIERLLT